MSQDERLTPKLLHRLSSRPTSEIYGALALFDRYFRDYFILNGALDGIRLRLQAHKLQKHPDVVGR